MASNSYSAIRITNSYQPITKALQDSCGAFLIYIPMNVYVSQILELSKEPVPDVYFKIEHFIPNTDRYVFDYGLCGNGFAQVDNTQDAFYYGTWCNPHSFMIVTYAEGDLTIERFRTKDEFIATMLRIKASEDFIGIDPGLKSGSEQPYVDLGLKHLLH